MTELVLFFVHYAVLLLFGLTVSAAFSGVKFSKANLIRLALMAAFSGGLQIAVYRFCGETAVWQWYPVITHLPIVLALRFLFGIRFPIAFSATASAYLCCQPAKWVGLAAFAVAKSTQAELLARIVMLAVTAAVILQWFAVKISRIFNHRRSSSWVFGIIPVVYYLFDYLVAIYSSLWMDNNRLSVEFLPLFLCVGHLVFCAVYYQEYELKNEAERKEQLLRITVEQQAKEVEMIRRSESQIRILRHDLLLFLNSLSTSINQGDKENAQKMISAFSAQAEVSSVKRYCRNDTLNYVLSDYAARCQKNGVLFQPIVELTEDVPDELLFSTILVNALDNAMNAQEDLAPDRRIIRLMLKTRNGKVLLCVKNPFKERPVFQAGVPVSLRKNHGYGVQSIRYAAEKMEGNCQFVLEDDWFVLRVVV